MDNLLYLISKKMKDTSINSIKIIKKVGLIHCARGPKICSKCKDLAQKEKKYCLLQVYMTSTNQTRPIIKITLDQNMICGEYDIIKEFKDYKVAENYAQKHSIRILND